MFDDNLQCVSRSELDHRWQEVCDSLQTMLEQHPDDVLRFCDGIHADAPDNAWRPGTWQGALRSKLLQAALLETLLRIDQRNSGDEDLAGDSGECEHAPLYE